MQPLILLHGAIGASGQLGALAERLSGSYKVYSPDFTGHGGRPIPDEPFSMKLFADDVLQLIEQEHLSRPAIFGYSMGGYVGMYLAKHHPERVGKVVTLATKYHWDETIAAREVQMLNPGKIAQKIPAFAATLQQRHAPADWKQVLAKTAEMMVALGSDNTLKIEDYAAINGPALLLLGDQDKMVTLDETQAVYKTLPAAQLGVLPNTLHPIEQVDVELLGFMMERFLR